MHPAFSVIFLTTFIGVGQGLFLALYTAQLFTLWGLLSLPNGHNFYISGSGLALGWLVAGLFASFFHLGHPERAWRALTRWRSSWLSREVLILPLVMAAIALYGLSHWLGIPTLVIHLNGVITLDIIMLIGILALVLTCVLFLATGMVYADVHLLQEWHHWLTVINFTLLGSASGFTMATMLTTWYAPVLTNFFTGWALILTITAAGTRIIMLLRNQHLTRPSSLRTAIGIRHHQIAQKAQGAMGGSFNTREFFHGHALFFITTIRNIFLLFTFVMPVLLLGSSWWYADTMLITSAFCVQLCGLIAERWYFFAQARHPQNLYYQAVS